MAAKDILLALKKFVFSTNVEHLFRQANSYKLLKKDFTKVSKVGLLFDFKVISVDLRNF